MEFSDTGLAGQISVLFFSSSLLLLLRVLARGGKGRDSDTDLGGGISVLFFSSSLLLLFSAFWLVGNF